MRPVNTSPLVVSPSTCPRQRPRPRHVSRGGLRVASRLHSSIRLWRRGAARLRIVHRSLRSLPSPPPSPPKHPPSLPRCRAPETRRRVSGGPAPQGPVPLGVWEGHSLGVWEGHSLGVWEGHRPRRGCRAAALDRRESGAGDGVAGRTGEGRRWRGRGGRRTRRTRAAQPRVQDQMRPRRMRKRLVAKKSVAASTTR